MSSLDPLSPAEPALAELRALRDMAAEHQDRRLAASTQRYQNADWTQYAAWCDRIGLPCLPVDPDTVSLYITDLARQILEDGTPRYRAASIGRHVASISRRHYEHTGNKGMGEHPAIADTLKGIRRLRQEAREAKRPLLLDDVTALLDGMQHDTWPAGVTAARDALAFWLGFAGALRRGEVAAMTAEEIVLQPLDGLHVRLRRSKTDQEGEGRLLGIPYGKRPQTCVVCAWTRWLRLVTAATRADRMRLVLETGQPSQWTHVCRGPLPGGDVTGPLLRRVTKSGDIRADSISGAALNARVKAALEKAGWDPTEFGFHSLRAGFVTQARRNGADARSVRRQTWHKSDDTVEIYDREYNPLEGNAVTRLGL